MSIHEREITDIVYNKEDCLQFANTRRLEVIEEYSPSVNNDEVLDYLGRETITTTHGNANIICDFLRKLMTDEEIHNALKQQGEQNPVYDMAVANSENMADFPQLFDGKNDPATFVSTLAAEIKTVAVIYKAIIGREPGPLFRRRFIVAIAKIFTERKVTVPLSLTKMIGKKDADELEKYKQRSDTVQNKPAINQTPLERLIESGILPAEIRFNTHETIEMIVGSFNEELANLNQKEKEEDKRKELAVKKYNLQLLAFFKSNPNPRQLIDDLLDLQNGRLPVNV
jgi:hypothetical protein